MLLMTEKEARLILRDTIQEDGSLYNKTNYISWKPGDDTVALDYEFFTADLLIAIAWWMKNMNDSK
jgi:hypothetical protein